MLTFNELFDSDFYLAQNPNVAADVNAGLTTAINHFNQIGQFQGLDPSPLFDTDYYLFNNPTVAPFLEIANLSPFQHYIDFGQIEGLNPSVLYENSYYLSANPDIAVAVQQDPLTGIEHFLKFGQFEGRRASAFFDENYYLEQNPTVAEVVEQNLTTAIQHYLEIGAVQNLEFTPFIEPGNSTLPNGVASGDTTQTSTILWTRTTVPGVVSFDYSSDPNFSTFNTIQTLATNPSVPVQVEVENLIPNTQYFYRATDATGTSVVGNLRTSAPLGSFQGLRFGVSGDWQGELTPYPSISNVPERKLDFFVQLGDTLETDSESPDLPDINQASNLQEFRTKYNEIYSERFGLNPWQELRESTTVYTTWDDHNITNDFAGGATPADSPQKQGIFGESEIGFVNDTPVFEQGILAFAEYAPLREEFYGETGDPRTTFERELYRFNIHGNDAATYMLDVRSFRDSPLSFLPETASQEEINRYLNDAFEPGRTMLGNAQLQQLKNDLLAAENSDITWKFIMSTVPMQYFGVPVAGERWEGFAAERTDLLRFIDNNNIDNVVFVTGDFHGHVVNDVTYQEGVGQPQIPTGAIDVMVGPVAIQLNIGQGPFAAPFGEATVAFTPDELLSPEDKEFYNSLTDINTKDAFVRQVVDNRITPLGYNPIGLEDSAIDAQVLQGSYVAAHTYGWTEFEIEPTTQQLLVKTYGVEPYTQEEIEANPGVVANQVPFVVNEFVVNPVDDVETAPGLPPAVAGAVIENVINDFGVPVENLTITAAQQQDWPDGCLGLAEAGEFCTQAIVPGWEVRVQSGEQVFVYRTDEFGSVVRLDPEATLPPSVSEAAIGNLINSFGLEEENLTIASAQQRGWNSCLGLPPEPGEGCDDLFLRGWEVTIQNGEQVFVYHTDGTGSMVRLNEAASTF
ncbi:MAG: alkaline phosphatase D family protein [Microcoleaceae cyanobacterium]